MQRAKVRNRTPCVYAKVMGGSQAVRLRTLDPASKVRILPAQLSMVF